MTEDKRPNGEPSEKVGASTEVEAQLRTAPETQGTEENSKRTLTKLFERGLSHAGVTLWKWNLKTGNLEFLTESADGAGHYPFPSPTTWEQIVHKHDRSRLLGALHNFENTSFLAFDCFFRLATKVPRWVHARDMHLSLDSDGKPAQVVGLFFDVTENELAKNQLFWGREPPSREEDRIRMLRMVSERQRHENDRDKISALWGQCYHEFMTLFSFSNLPAFRKDVHLDTVEVNPAMSQLLNIPSDQILRRTDQEIWGSNDGIRVQKLCGYALLGETVLVNSTRCINGVETEFFDQIYPEWGPNGRVVGVCGIMAPLSADLILGVESPKDGGPLSPAMRKVYTLIQSAAQFHCNVLLTGESGSGKDFFARQIHDLSKGLKEPFENFNCAALQSELAGSELFGHEAGAFTGAKNRRKGIFELASNGTVFLNEIGDMSLDLQPKLLTVLESREFRRVGGEQHVALKARIIAATNRDLNKEVEEGLFRKDLYHRLNVFTIRVPPLRERLDELPSLIEKLLSKISTNMELDKTPEIDPMAMRKLRTHNWPGNIRELGNVLERAVIHSHGAAIGPDHILFETQSDENSVMESPETIPHGKDITKPGERSSSASKMERRPRRLSDDELKRLYHGYIVEKDWSRAQLATYLAVDSSTLKKWLKEAGLPAGRAGRPRKIQK